MIKTIKVKKSFRLDELIKYARDNGVKSQAFVDDAGRASVYFGSEQRISFGEYGYGDFGIDRTFTVEIEEPITEDTVFKCLLEIIDGELVYIRNKKTIKESLKDDTDRFYALIDGKLELVWERDGE